MAVKAFRTLTLIRLLSLSVVALTSTVALVPVAAATSGGGTCGDPDSPKDTAPRASATQSSSSVASTSQVSDVMPVYTSRQAVRWMLVEQMLSSLFGRPGLMR